MSTRKARRTVVTGIGVVAPNGTNTEAFWKRTQEGMSVLDRVTREGCEDLPLHIMRRGPRLRPGRAHRGALPRPDRPVHALRDGRGRHGPGRRPARPRGLRGPAVRRGRGHRGRSSGGGEFGQRELQRLWGQGSTYVGPYQSIAWFYAASTGQISIRGGFKGPCAVVASDEAGGLDAIAHADRSVRRGTDAVVVGAAEAPLAPYSVVCQLGYRDLSAAQDPTRAYRPFTSDACGFVPAEGGAMFVVEEEESARERGARVRAEVAGHAATFTTAAHWEESREGLAHAIEGALREAGCAPDEVDVVFADALGSPAADRAEALALADALGPHSRMSP